jgi:hypothetical protein
MNEDFMKKAVDQARDLQQKIAEAMSKGQEQAQPFVEQTMKQADALRETLVEHGKRSADLTHEQTTKALDDLNHAMKAGSEAMRAQTEAARPLINDFFARAREAADHVTKTFKK